MLRIALAVTVVSISSIIASAADLAPRPYTNALIMPPIVYDWTGFYVGGNLGWSFGRSHTDFNIAGSPFAWRSERMDGILGGLQAGYNWQPGAGLFGLETDIQATGQRGSSTLTKFIPGTPDIAAVPGIPSVTAVLSYQNKLPWFGTFRGRLGFTPAERWIVYGTGGFAYGEVRTSETLNVNGTSVFLDRNDTKLGWTVGAGVEGALWDSWTAKLEYLYMDFGTISNSLTGIAPITPVRASSHITDQIVRVGLNYRLGGYIARY